METFKLTKVCSRCGGEIWTQDDYVIDNDSVVTSNGVTSFKLSSEDGIWGVPPDGDFCLKCSHLTQYYEDTRSAISELHNYTQTEFRFLDALAELFSGVAKDTESVVMNSFDYQKYYRNRLKDRVAELTRTQTNS